MLGNLASRFARIFAIDLRSLAMFRIAAAGAVLFDLACRAGDLAAHYTESGVLPVQPVGGLDRLSLHAWLSGSPAAVAALFGVAGLAAVALALGWHARLAAVLSWYLLASVQLRNPPISQMGGDVFLRLVLFWGMFLPLAARFSLDARRRGQTDGANLLLSVPGAALLIQVALMYMATGFLKDGETWRTGRALWYALQLDYWVAPLGVWLRPHEAWLGPMTFASLWFERLGVLIAFFPIRRDVFRMLAVVLFVGFHLSIAALIDVGPFPLFCLSAWPAFLPSRFWDDWLPRLRGIPARHAHVHAPVVTQPLVVQAVAGVLLAYVVVYVATESRPPGRDVLPRVALRVGNALRLHQRWSMFTPDPRRIDLWPLVEGELANGRRIDLLRAETFELTQPEHIPASMPGFRWRLFFRTAMEDWFEPDRREGVMRLYRGYARYLCASWRSPDGDTARLRMVRIHHGIEHTLPDRPGPRFYQLVLAHGCAEPAERND
jgi:hypothetical protein